MSSDRQGLRQEQRLGFVPSAAQLQFMSLLSLPQEQLGDLLESALRDNPLLQRSPGGPCTVCGRHCRSGVCAECRTLRLPAAVAPPVPWRLQLLHDLRAALPRALHPMAEAVVGSLDDHGLLRDSEGSRSLTSEERDIRETVLAALREIGPPGIGARSPVEVVRRQVEALVAQGAAPALLLDMVEHHLEEVAAGDMAALAESLQVAPAEAAAAVECLRARTRPFVAVGDCEPRGPAPDVAFSLEPQDGSRILVRVPDLDWFGVELDEELWRSVGGEGRSWLQPYRQEAIQLFRAVRARSDMLVRVAEELAVRQRGYLLDGDAGHQALTRRELASSLAVHPSTVGRVTEGKVARCPDGRMVPLAGFFGGRTRALTLLDHLVESRPGCTDAELRALLQREGIHVARRTVAKYRALIRARTR